MRKNQILTLLVMASAFSQIVSQSSSVLAQTQGGGNFGEVMQAASPVPSACYTIDLSQVRHLKSRVSVARVQLQSDLVFLKSLQADQSSVASGLVMTKFANDLVGILDTSATTAREMALLLDKTGRVKWMLMGADMLSAGAGTVTDAVLGSPKPEAKLLQSLESFGRSAVDQAMKGTNSYTSSVSPHYSKIQEFKRTISAARKISEKAMEYADRSTDIGTLYSEVRSHQIALQDDQQRLIDVFSALEGKLDKLEADASRITSICTDGNSNTSSIAGVCAQLVADASQSSDAKGFAPLFARLRNECPPADADKARSAFMVNAASKQQEITTGTISAAGIQASNRISNAKYQAESAYANDPRVKQSMQAFQEAQMRDAIVAQQQRRAQKQRTGWQSGGGGDVCASDQIAYEDSNGYQRCRGGATGSSGLSARNQNQSSTPKKDNTLNTSASSGTCMNGNIVITEGCGKATR